jgi:hypothetical protein
VLRQQTNQNVADYTRFSFSIHLDTAAVVGWPVEEEGVAVAAPNCDY